MKTVKFKEANRLLASPPSMPEGTACVEMWIWTDEEVCISSWRMSWRERFSALFFGRVWLGVLSGGTQAPVALCANRSGFNEHA